MMIAVSVTGMTCASCAQRVIALFHEQELTDVQIDVVLEQALLSQRPTAQAVRRLQSALAAAGYDLAQRHIHLLLEGVIDDDRAANLQARLLEVPGVLATSLDVPGKRLEVLGVEGLVDYACLAQRVKKAGYAVGEAQQESSGEGADREVWWLSVSGLLTLPLLLGMFGMLLDTGWELPGWLQWLLATPVQFVFGARFYKGAFFALRSRTANMDTLVAVGTSCAYLYSTSALLWPEMTGGQLYFESAAVVITLVRLGKFLESNAKVQAAGRIRSLERLAPPEAERLIDEGGTERVPIDRLELQDQVLVRPGSRLPVDGLVLAGTSEVDESLVTGESNPVSKGPGASVFSGTLNGTGLLTLSVTALAGETLLAQIARQVQQAQAQKPPVQRLTDRISQFFVPTVLLLALLVFLLWWLNGNGFAFALMAAVSVLVVACPCALGLATPTALVAGIGLAARKGILVRDFSGLENLHRTDLVAFDKTGTLTVGRPTLARLEALGDWSEEDLLRFAASVQQGSEHLLASALIQAAEDRSVELLPMQGFRSLPGMGVAAEVAGRKVLAGNSRLLVEQGVALDSLPELETAATRVLLAVDGNLAGWAELRDQVRTESRAAVETLRRRGLGVAMLSGDNDRVAQETGERLALNEIHAQLLPEEKQQQIQRWQQQGLQVAMVGDGVNDAPALARANTGIAMGSGTDIAAETAAILLVRPNPCLVAVAIRLSRLTMNSIRQNLFWAFAYNLLCIPVAGLGLMTPALAGAAMALSSLCVVANSLRLARTRIDD